MTRYENYINFLKRENYEWIPTSADQRFFHPEEIWENVVRGLVSQQEPFDSSLYGGTDYFGVHWTFHPEAAGMGGSMEDAPLMNDLADWRDKVVFPDLDKIDWEGCAKRNAEYLNTDKIISTTFYTGFFERLISFVGFEDAAACLVDEDYEDDVLELLDKLADFYIDILTRMNKYLNVQYVNFHDDWGAQKSPFFSPATVRRMIVPAFKKLTEGLHKAGIIVGFHCCGMVEPLVPCMIEAGVDTWRGQELNDKYKLVCQYGDQFTFQVFVMTGFMAPPDSFLKDCPKIFEQYQGKHVLFDIPFFYPEKVQEEAGKILQEMCN